MAIIKAKIILRNPELYPEGKADPAWTGPEFINPAYFTQQAYGITVTPDPVVAGQPTNSVLYPYDAVLRVDQSFV